MTIKVGINGYGRIGRNVLRALYESGKNSEIEIVAVNDLGDANTNAHLTRRDTAHGPFPGTVEVDGDYMIVNGDRIRVLAERDPSNLPWGDLGVDIVLESTGFFTTRDTAGKHLEAGAKKVVISAPGGADIDATIVYGVNHDVLKAGDTIHIKGHTSDFTHTVDSLQVDGETVESAGKGSDVGVKVGEYAREHDDVFKVEG